MDELTVDDVVALRMASLQLAARPERSPAEVVEWFGAMQAQDLASGEWSFGVRCVGSTQRDIRRATVDRQILRTWPMRGTVHFVPPRDAKWMLEVTGVRALAGAARRREHLGLTEAIVDRAAEVLAGALRGGGCLTRADCVELLIDAGVHTASSHGYHLLWYASQIGVTCIGPQQGKDQTFVLLDEWVPEPFRPDRDEALLILAQRYFRSHGPATRQDFAGWTGLSMADVKRGIELAGDDLVTVDVDGTSMSMPASLRDDATSVVAAQAEDELLLLAGFDEYLLGFKDRSAVISGERMAQVVPGRNGVFRPTIVVGGRVVGTWTRKVQRNRVDITPLPFEPLNVTQLEQLHAAANAYGSYLELEAHLVDLDR